MLSSEVPAGGADGLGGWLAVAGGIRPFCLNQARFASSASCIGSGRLAVLDSGVTELSADALRRLAPKITSPAPSLASTSSKVSFLVGIVVVLSLGKGGLALKAQRYSNSGNRSRSSQSVGDNSISLLTADLSGISNRDGSTTDGLSWKLSRGAGFLYVHSVRRCCSSHSHACYSS